MKIGYKATYNYICRGCIFEIGKTRELKGTPIPCKYGFHYCVKPKDVLNYYPIRNCFRLLEIEDLGDSIVKNDKTATNKIRIIREISKEEYYQLFGIVNNELTFVDEFDGWVKYEFDERNNQIYCETSNGLWEKRTYDEYNICLKRESGRK
jgi:hypothetical protein